MIAVGIPSLNEADNIAKLVKFVDEHSSLFKEPIVVINCDNNSEDGTARVFRSTPTLSQKVSLITNVPGKGRNIRRILDYICAEDIDYCLFIDGDVTSLEPLWFTQHRKAIDRRLDYVVPSYSRYLQEGNMTNHFAYPLLYAWTSGRSPRQPIAGDFGVSNKFARYLLKQKWTECTYGYGVDIFMTIHSLSAGFKTLEISLPKKIHKPSFSKMVRIFLEEAEAYYECIENLRFNNIHFESEAGVSNLLAGAPITESQISVRREEAKKLYTANSKKPKLPISFKDRLSIDEWAVVLLAHDQLVGKISAREIAQSVCPFYLIRAITYLEDVNNPQDAYKEIEKQCRVVEKAYRGITNDTAVS